MDECLEDSHVAVFVSLCSSCQALTSVGPVLWHFHLPRVSMPFCGLPAKACLPSRTHVLLPTGFSLKPGAHATCTVSALDPLAWYAPCCG